MITFHRYNVIEQIYESANSLVYRGTRKEDNHPVILKMLKEDYPSPAKLAQYRQEHEITRDLNIDGVIKTYGLEKHQNTLMIILEDFGGESLARLMATFLAKKEGTSSSLFFKGWLEGYSEFLSLAIKLTEILSEIHAADVIHKDINPGNIVMNRVTGQVKIIDFGISTVLPRENPIIKSPGQLEGTLAYIAPEQTGRMNRVIDYRTDFYSLGVTFYELLTRQLPFDTKDPMELLHCHLAGQPASPQRLNPEIPEVISNLIMKLLEKTAEARYQSTWGLKADLQECQTCLAQGETFLLGRQDHSEKFQLSQKLYGREHEIKTLLAAFERVGQGPSEMMLVAGYSGIGKSALVREIYKPVTQKRGYFITGKFDQLQRNIPYSAFMNAFAGLVHQLLTESKTRLGRWKEKILGAVGPNGQVIIEVIPEMESITGKQPQVPELPAAESQNRFNLVFQNFIKVFTRAEHPLVIFLDDLQWADGASLKLMQLLMAARDIHGLFLIGAYRDNKVNEVHPLTLTLKEIKESNALIHYLSLQPLELRHVTQLIGDALQCGLEKAHSLAESVHAKTDGNPFFMNEFLQSLHVEGLLAFDIKEGVWHWDLRQIEARGFTDNVVDLITGKIQKLPANTQQALKLAACIGNRFDLATLATVLEKSPQETSANLWEAVIHSQLSIISSRTPAKLTLTMDNQSLINECQFVHGRIQQAAYSLIPDEQKQVVHLGIGRLLLQNIPLEEREQKIFAIVDQLNEAGKLINRQSERNELAELNLIAGKKAKASTAYQPAFDYLSIGIGLLGGEGWRTKYKLTLALHEEGAEAAYLSGHFNQMERWTEVVLQQAETVLDKVKVYEVKIQACQAQNQITTALRIGLQVLELLNIKLPKSPGKWHIIFELLLIKSALFGKRTEDLARIPETAVPEQKAIMRILVSTVPYAYMMDPELFILMVLKGVRLSLKYGNVPGSAFAYSGYATLLCGHFIDIEKGCQFGELVLSLLERFNREESITKTRFVVYALVKHWKCHIKEILAPLLEVYRHGLDTGDLEFSGYAIVTSHFLSYLSGKKLSEVESHMRSCGNAIRQFKQGRSLNYLSIYHQTILNLQGYSAISYQLTGEVYDENIMLPQYKEVGDGNSLFIVYYSKLMLCYLLEMYPEAFECARETEKYQGEFIGFAYIPIFHFYDSLVRLALYANETKYIQWQYRKKIRANQKKMKKWAYHAPMNYQHKFDLVEAEWHRVLGQDEKAMKFYDKAIALAKEHEYLNEEALAHELAAKFYLSRKKDKIARVYFRDAHYAYTQWGAKAKVEDLETRYARFFEKTKTAPKPRTITVSATMQIEPGGALDLSCVLKASQTIAGEMELKKLLEKLMKIVIGNAGAQRGFLLLEKDGQWFVEAEGVIDKEEGTMLQSIPLARLSSDDEGISIPETIIHYVINTEKDVVLHDAVHEGQFTDDPHVLRHQTKSALCMPLLTRGRLSAMLYLENNLATGAFTPDRLEVLKLLSSQIVMSIQNARNYKEMVDTDIKNARMKQAHERFVPHDFLRLLGGKNVSDVQPGERITRKMTVLFARTHVPVSEDPQQQIDFINDYPMRMESLIRQYRGVIVDKHISDTITAVFSSADAAMQSSVAMLKTSADYNRERQAGNLAPVSMKIGLDTGQLTLGFIGNEEHMECMAVSEAVNTASHIAGLMTADGAIISENTRLEDASRYAVRAVDNAALENKQVPVAVYEIVL